MFNTPEQIAVVRAMVIRSALKLYALTGIRANSEYTPANMLRAAAEITGKKFKRGQYTEAIAALDVWINSKQAKP